MYTPMKGDTDSVFFLFQIRRVNVYMAGLINMNVYTAGLINTLVGNTKF